MLGGMKPPSILRGMVTEQSRFSFIALRYFHSHYFRSLFLQAMLDVLPDRRVLRGLALLRTSVSRYRYHSVCRYFALGQYRLDHQDSQDQVEQGEQVLYHSRVQSGSHQAAE